MTDQSRLKGTTSSIASIGGNEKVRLGATTVLKHTVAKKKREVKKLMNRR